MKKFLQDFYKRINLQKDNGFTIIEVLIAMALLSFVMGISMNVLSIVLDMTNDSEYNVVVTQESNYAAESIKRMVRSAESFAVKNSGYTLDVNYQGKLTTFSFVEKYSGSGTYILKKDSQSIMSSEVYVQKISNVPFFSVVTESGDNVGVKMAFKIYHSRDERLSSGTILYTQAIARNIILNK